MEKAEDETVIDETPAVIGAPTAEAELQGAETGAPPVPAPLAAQDPTRKILLDDLFEACDDDGSGALSLDEFSKLFDKKLDSQADIRAALKMADVQQVDGKLSKDEFVTYHLQKFAATEDS
eukprot:1820063-Prymnesium_polylepis.1